MGDEDKFGFNFDEFYGMNLLQEVFSYEVCISIIYGAVGFGM